MDCYYYKYHLKSVAQVLPNDEAKKVFFWMRTSDVTWDIVKKLLGENYEGEIIIKTTSDPDCKIDLPSKEDIGRYNIKIVNNWLDKEEYDKLLSSCNVFIAPRQFEGIGMSFIEALSRGICVIAPNNSTMNEYIIHGRNGLLYDLKNPEELNLDNLAEIRKNTAKTAKEDYELWEKAKRQVLIDLAKANKKCKLIKLLYFQLIHIFLIPYVIWEKLIRKILKFWQQKG
ncbi:glycosyltransferase family 4 protein [bacterium]|nr:glycosyltransferase family 4 protein [bacterium]